MNEHSEQALTYLRDDISELDDGTLVLSFHGWMDGGDVSTGTIQRLIDLTDAKPLAEIDPEPFYLLNFPGPMEIATLFRPEIKIEDGIVREINMPTNTFYGHPSENVVLFVGKEPNMHWRSFARCMFNFAERLGIIRILFVGSFGGSVPHTREPRLYVVASEPRLLEPMDQFGVRRTGYEGPGSFISYMMTEAQGAGFEMTSLVAEIPGYLQGVNPVSIEAVTRRLAKILQLPVDLDSLRQASTEWEFQISNLVEETEGMAEKVRELEADYDDELLEEEG